MMHIEIDRLADPALHDELAAALTRVLAEVRLAVEDWRPMRRACLDAIADLAPSHSPNLAEYDDFLRWLEANNFTFLGHRRYRYVDDATRPAACARPDAGLRPRHPAARRGAAVRAGLAAARRWPASRAGRTTS
jgi:NAD-specific glutamate dehydrogenase